ncbi:DUF6787 family protein [Aurantibacter aestuarii]|uniref:DUF6787 domain-containing protein n=1 Tax=Aurantibacter aestuarii TaxID=1266046 RepID=A0A2T1N8J0_9FLAO|nr:DUF6787 family protein [Aurantibacter aestuarii]PSG88143.1 hypothetical protein C7H52_07505 [Aurantibacter aestuarii]
MEDFKKRWEITKNWQLLFPLLGIIGLLFSSFRLVNLFINDVNIYIKFVLSLVLTVLLIKLCLIIFKKLEHKWVVNQRWEIIRIFIVFAITGSSSLFVGRPIIKALGITKENLNIVVYYILFTIIALIFYQILLVTFGWIFGQFKFFWEFEKKMLRRFGLGRLLD